MRKRRIIKLEEGDGSRIRFLSDRISLQDGRTTSVVNITRTGRFYDQRYGDFDITPAMLSEMVRNFDDRVLGQDIFLDVAHKPSDGAAAKVNRLFVQGDRLRADVSWTQFGADAVKKRGFRYLSAEFSENFVSNEHPRKEYGTVLQGAALTVRPVIKHLDPINPDSIQLAEDDFTSGPTLIDPGFKRLLSEEVSAMNEFLKKLSDALKAKKLAEPVIKMLSDLFTAAAERLGDDKVALQKLTDGFILQGENLGKHLAEHAAGGGGPGFKLDLSGFEALITGIKTPGAGGETKGLSEADFNRLLDEREQKRTKELAALETALKAAHTAFDTLLAEKGKEMDADSLKELTDGIRPTITASTTVEQAKALA